MSPIRSTKIPVAWHSGRARGRDLAILLLGIGVVLAFASKPGLAQEPSASVAKASVPEWPGKAVDWNGFEKFEFQVAGRKAYVVRPREPAPGNPWVWRARFPNFHAEADLILLQRGFHVARIDTDGMLGSPAAMEIWDTFYQFLTERGLASACALEGVSRGGLFVYGFASRWPERVACLYADTPVCDIRSWPAGWGEGIGDAGTWKSCLQQYGLTEATARTFRGNPIDRVEPLVKAGIPLLHVISKNDRVVPPAENTRVLQARVEELGGSMAVIEVEQGTEASSGHHFQHPDPVRVADFIERHAVVLPMTQDRPAADYFTGAESLSPIADRFRRTGRGRVAFLGGSITAMTGWRQLTMDYLRARFPKTEFEFIDAGIPSTGSVPGAFRLSRDVLADGPVDLLFEEASVNDLTNGRSAEQMIRGMEGIVRRARQSNPAMGVVVMHFVCPEHTRDYRQGKTPATIERHQRVADHYGVAAIDLAREVTDRIDARQFDWDHDFRNLHPSPYGHRVYAATIRRLLSTAWSKPVDSNTDAAQLPQRLDPDAYDDGQLIAPAAAVDRVGFEPMERCDPREVAGGGGVRPGFFEVPMLVGLEPKASFAFPFQGRAVGIWVVAGPDAGVIEYRLDDGPWKTRDLMTRWSGGLHLPWVHVLADGLDPRTAHRLQVRIAETAQPRSGGTAVRVVHLLVNGPDGDERP